LVSILLNINYFDTVEDFNGTTAISSMQHPGTGENIWTGNIYFFLVSILLNINYFWYNKGFLLIYDFSSQRI